MDKEVKKQQYKYDLNSNLVIQGASTGNREGDPTGEASTLVGRQMAPFGDLATREKPPQPPQTKQSKPQKKKEQSDFIDPSRTTKFSVPDTHQSSILDVQIEEDLVYRPKTKDTKQIYEQFIQIISHHMGDHSTEIIRGAGDEVLAILKTDSMTDHERKREIESIIDKMTEETFNQLTILAQQLVDYSPEEYGGDREERDMEARVSFDEMDEEEKQDLELVQESEDEEEKEMEGVQKREQAEQDDQHVGAKRGQGRGAQETSQQQQQKQQGLILQDIDAHFLKRLLSEYIKDKMPEELLPIEEQVLNTLRKDNARECDQKLAQLFNYEHPELNRILVKNRFVIFFGVLLAQTDSQGSKDQIYQQMEGHKEGKLLLSQLHSATSGQQSSLLDQATSITKRYTQLTQSEVKDALHHTVTTDQLDQKLQKSSNLDFDQLAFNQGARLMANKKCSLPKGSTRITKQGYEEVYVPAIKHKSKDTVLIPISDLPEWARHAFPPPITKLNQIQSRLYGSAFKSSENLLVCAPTGAGKTNIALLSILQILSQKRKTNGKIDKKSFKIVYIAPMRALVTEIVGNFQNRLQHYDLKVRELTGDVHLTKAQIDETQIIVTTPEKWDIITRKSGERAYIDLVKLIIIDEIHLLHDGRGPVLESIVARTIRQIEQTSELVRIVALSATLPNYEDVAAFLRVKPESGLFFFDNSFRPVPLEQIYIGITEKKAIKRVMLMNEVCYDKVMERAGKHQILVFVHSRKETARTAKIIRDMALAKDELHKFLRDDSASKEILQREADTSISSDVKDLIPYGIGIHHAGLDRKDRMLVEQLFADGHLQVLVSTATLAWGVNLPAHTVIIKGTQIYSPEQGKWIELSPQDMLQMMGRAGRPQYDSLGEGIIITNHSELQYHLSLNNQQLPIESQLISQVADILNAEIVLGTISNTKEAINWLAYTYLYVRMLRQPSLYGIDPAELQSDPILLQRRADLVHTAALLLQKASMIKYEKMTGTFQSTALGKIASHYYIKHNSMSVYNENLKPYMGIIDVFRLFSLSKEFQFIPVRDNEKLELQKFIDRVPIPVKGGLDEGATKINILLQAYISRFKLDGYDLNADMVYVTQSAGRIMRSLFEICLKRGWAQLTETLLNLCKMVERRMWSSMTPLRQYHGIPEDILRKIEKKEQFTWQHFYVMSAQQIGEIVKLPKMGKIIHKLVHNFPKLELDASVQPLTRTLIKIELEITPNFEWEPKIHGRVEPFWILVEDSDSEKLLHYEQFILKDRDINEQQIVTLTVPLYEPMPPQYFIKIVSDRWLQSERVLPISFKHLILPDRFAPPMELQDKPFTLVKELAFKEAEELYQSEGINEFNSIITQAFNKVYQTEESVFVGAPSGSQLQIVAELAIFKEVQVQDYPKIVYIGPVTSLCKLRYQQWKERLENQIGINVGLLTGNSQKDLALLQQSDLVISTPEHWDYLQRKWRQRKLVQQVTLYIFDEIHLLSDQNSTYEVIASRTRYMQNELEKRMRIVALGTSLANAKDVASWLGITYPNNCFNFHPSVRPNPLQIHIQGFDHNNKQTRLLSMQRPAYNALKKNLNLKTDSQSIIFVSDRKQSRLTSLDLVTFSSSDEEPKRFLNLQSDSQEEHQFLKHVHNQISEQTLQSTLPKGVGFIHDGLSDSELRFVKRLYKDGLIRVLVVTYDLCWEVSDLESHLVLILDAERYDGHLRRNVEYSIPDMIQMMGRANLTQSLSRHSPTQPAKCFLYCHTPKKDYFIKFLQEPLPLESHLDHHLHDHLNAEIVSGTIESKQDAVDWITWTFMYRRIAQNPNYYNIAGRSGQHINDHLSELIENTVEELQAAKCVEVGENDMDLEAGNLGRIIAFYYIKYQTIETFAKYLEGQSSQPQMLKFLIEVLSKSQEFENIPIRQGEEALLRSFDSKLSYRLTADDPNEEPIFNEPHNKANILLQCHFNRTPLNTDLRIDQKYVLQQSVKLCHAMIDVISSYGYLKPCLVAMELSKQVVQAMWANQSPLLQLPYLDEDLIDALKKKANVEDIVDFLNMEEEDRNKLVKITEQQMLNLAQVCNRYPSLELQVQTDKSRYQNEEKAELLVTITRADVEEDSPEELEIFKQPVHAQYYPLEKEEQWWVVIGQPKNNKLLSIKKISNFKAQRQISQKLAFTVSKEGQEQELDYKVYLICDSYVGCDQAETFKVKVD